MGRTWVGFQPVVKPVSGPLHSEEAELSATVSDAEIVRLLTTASGLAAWLAPTTAFSDRRGGNIDFTSDSGAFAGSYSLIEVPRHVVLVTDRHGEIDVRVDVNAVPTTVRVRVRCAVPEGEDVGIVAGRARSIISSLGGCIGHGREAQ